MTSKNLYHFFTQFKSQNLIMPKRNSYSVDYPVFDKQLFQYFFFEKSKVGETVSAEMLDKLLQHYPDFSGENRVSSRFTVDIPAVIVDPATLQHHAVVIKNISTTGIRIVSAANALEFLEMNSDYQIQFAHKNSVFEMTIESQWNKAGTQAGFTVRSNQLNWHRLLRSINFKYTPSADVRDVFMAYRKAS